MPHVLQALAHSTERNLYGYEESGYICLHFQDLCCTSRLCSLSAIGIVGGRARLVSGPFQFFSILFSVNAHVVSAALYCHICVARKIIIYGTTNKHEMVSLARA